MDKAPAKAEPNGVGTGMNAPGLAQALVSFPRSAWECIRKCGVMFASPNSTFGNHNRVTRLAPYANFHADILVSEHQSLSRGAVHGFRQFLISCFLSSNFL